MCSMRSISSVWLAYFIYFYGDSTQQSYTHSDFLKFRETGCKAMRVIVALHEDMLLL